MLNESDFTPQRTDKFTQVYFTNSGSSLNKEQKLELKKIDDVCKVVYLCSPSPVNPKRSYCLEDYLNKIKL